MAVATNEPVVTDETVDDVEPRLEWKLALAGLRPGGDEDQLAVVLGRAEQMMASSLELRHGQVHACIVPYAVHAPPANCADPGCKAPGSASGQTAAWVAS